MVNPKENNKKRKKIEKAGKRRNTNILGMNWMTWVVIIIINGLNTSVNS